MTYPHWSITETTAAAAAAAESNGKDRCQWAAEEKENTFLISSEKMMHGC